MSNILHLDKNEFETTLSDNELVFVDFWATWCGPCKMLEPIVNQVADMYAEKVVFAKIDIDKQQDLASEYGIQSVPTVILFKNGEEVAREVGVKLVEIYSAMIDANE